MPSNSVPRYADSVPALMRAARGAYKRAVDAELAARGIDDLPRAGGFVLAMLSGDDSVEDAMSRLGVTKQAFSQLIEALVARGYVTRGGHPTDRRRIVVDLTDRGRLAADAVIAGASEVDDQVRRRLSASELAGMRKGLAVLAEIKAGASESK